MVLKISPCLRFGTLLGCMLLRLLGLVRFGPASTSLNVVFLLGWPFATNFSLKKKWCFLALISMLLVFYVAIQLKMFSTFSTNVQWLVFSCKMARSPFPPCWQDWLDGNFSPGRHDGIMMDWGLLYFSAVIHTIWSERNSRIHSSKIKNNGQLLLVVKSMVREKLFTCNKWKKYASKHPNIISLLY